ncbi:hypothetical protein CO115_02145 [Candidatus Falkowbacteria bacterium CG_4_9_14_3_um_filter_36_9]|uniref:histidine kinase n=2 Tax=Candidatus Falkowiibacteriota TaxID=1752728 RepID=A0A1J4T911_9BACT|nr:MAG: hypothetical protein AUJ27_02550 [Candidatus Falkowbacteria bacterium CG1_02_37_44]PIV50446.1 MAG: hypothetical protein COS18_05065 [Candidatus Falkowbacteria bacterium CG02_land_8_20_14_3_00_36_14]PJA11121.1 MAG: hypothetical protein COX67_01410 [Candidatus Falkowbacteria bacterium CG_4_10_14_0_2_um_filter_36_22]PJB19913.1 MAG: hypothetical protein CO115_02145 [Candidatus Falkowbacteria bacterium CG_4_9_14_3_um_filter_36_9]
MNFKEFLVKNREIAQLVYGVILIILIPLLIAINTIFIINRYNKNIDSALLLQSLTVSRTTYALIKNDLANNDILQKKIDDIINRNSNFEEIYILKPEGDNFKVVASSNLKNVNKIYTTTFYQRAWISNDNEGKAVDSNELKKYNENGDLIDTNKKDRYWLASIPMRDINGSKQALLTMKLSSKIIDDLTNYNRNMSIYLLIGTVFIIILFLLVAVRLWDYAILYKKIKEVDKMKDEFISVASHELRTPVTGIRGYISMILEGSMGKTNKRITDSLKLVEDATKRLAVLIDDLLNVSRIEQGRMKIISKPVNIKNIIEDTIKELKIQADEKNLSLKFITHDNNFPLINIDNDRLKQVLINLIGNAIKYTPQGSVKIITEEKDNKILELRIKDTGIGMSTDDRERLFEKFYRVQNERTKNITGTGLGLWITKRLVELMGGKIKVDSIENIGTQVTLVWPIIKKK